MCHNASPSLPEALSGPIERLADALQVLMLSVEICQREIDPRSGGTSDLYAVNSRLLVIAADMRSLLLGLRRDPAGRGPTT